MDLSYILLIIIAVGSFITAILFGYSLSLLDRRQRLAYDGDKAAAKKLILPCYRPLYIGLSVYFALLSIAILITLVNQNMSQSDIYIIIQFHSLCLLAAFTICPLLFIQHSVSIRGFVLTTIALLPWFTTSNLFLFLSFAENLFLPSQIVFLFVTFLPTFFLSVGILSRTIVSRIRLGSRSNRNTVEHLLIFVIIFALLNLLVIIDSSNANTVFIMLMTYVVVTFTWNLLFVLSLHRSLLADTKFWRGLGQHNQGITAAPQVHDLPHPAIEFSVASTFFQEMMSNIGSLVIDFAFLEAKERIGDGSTSIVYSGQYKGQSVAIKMSTPNEITQEVINEFIKEGKLSSSFDHKNIVRFLGLCVRPPQIAFVTEFCEEGNLKSSLKRHPMRWRPKMKLKACLDACKAVEYIHSKSMIHRDIKTENFFVTGDMTVKLGDFGETISQHSQGERMTIVGTVSYMAPELIAAAHFYTNCIDIYALGITFWEIWTGHDAYSSMSHFEIYKFVGEGKRPDTTGLTGATPEFISLLTSAWHQDPDQRPTAKVMVTAFETMFAAEKDVDVTDGGPFQTESPTSTTKADNKQWWNRLFFVR